MGNGHRRCKIQAVMKKAKGQNGSKSLSSILKCHPYQE